MNIRYLALPRNGQLTAGTPCHETTPRDISQHAEMDHRRPWLGLPAARDESVETENNADRIRTRRQPQVIETRQLQAQMKNVAKLYGDHHVQALSGISLDIHRGEFIALMGASGCGKSTLLNIMGGIDRASSGAVLLDDADLTQMNDDQLTKMRASKIGFVFQFFNLLSTLTVRENVALPLELLGKMKRAEVRQKVDTMLARVNISQRADFYSAHLSGGELQRTAIARALIHKPELILADEPTGNLDTENGTAILELLRSINTSDGLTIIMATHSPDAAAYAQRILHIKDGLLLGESEQCSTT